MSRFRVGAAFALGLVAGYGLGFFGPGKRTPDGAAERLVSETPFGGQAPLRLAPPEPSREAAPGSAAPRAIERVPSPAAELASWTAQLDVPAPRSGNAAMTGRLVRSFEQREPFANVELVLEEASVSAPSPSAERSFEEWLRATAEQELARRSNLRRTTTDANGEFRFEALPADARFRLRAPDDDLRLELESGGSLYSLDPRPLGDVRALELALVELALTRADGGELARARVVSSSDEGQTVGGWTKNQTRRVLPVGSVEFEASTEDGAWVAPKLRAELVRGPQRLELVLASRPVIYGHFEPRDASARRGLEVHLIEASSSAPSTAALLAAPEKRSLDARLQYVFSFGERAPGTYALAVFSGSQVVSEVAHATIGANPCEVVLRELAGTEQQLLRVMLETPPGVELGGCSVYAGAVIGERKLEESVYLRRAEDGAYLVAEPALPENTAEARSYVRVRCSLGEQTVFYERGATRELRVAFSALALLAVDLTGFAPAELTRIFPALRRLDGAPNENTPAGWARTTAEDDPPSLATHRELRSVQPGEYELALLCIDRGPNGIVQQWPLLTRRLTLAPGPQSVELARPPLHELVVQLPPNELRYSCSLMWPAEGGRTVALTPPDADRRVRFGLLPAGSYRLVYKEKGGAAKELEVEVPSAGVVQLQE